MSKKSSTPPHRKRGKATSFFLRGLVTVLPVVFTVFIFIVVVNFVTNYVTTPINNAIYWTFEHNALGWRALGLLDIDPYDPEYLAPSALPIDIQSALLSDGFTPENNELLAAHRSRNETFVRDFDALGIDSEKLRKNVTGSVHPIVGLAVSILLVLTLGSLAGGFFGRRLINRMDQGLHRIPLVRSVYPYTKQLVEFFLAESKLEFETVVAAPYPSEGIWAIGFVTSAAMKTLRDRTGENLVSVFIPTSPMPMTGFTIFVPASKLIPLPFGVDEALRVTVSGGVLVPPSEAVEKAVDEILQGSSEKEPAS